jgi:hypothetical protein
MKDSKNISIKKTRVIYSGPFHGINNNQLYDLFILGPERQYIVLRGYIEERS